MNIQDINPAQCAMDADWLSKQSLFIASPLLDSRCHSAYTLGLLGLQEQLAFYRIPYLVRHCNGVSVISSARNILTHQFLTSGCSHLLMLDGDVFVHPHDLVRLLMLSKTHEGIIGVPYSKKGHGTGLTCQPQPQDVPLNVPVEVDYVGAGCLLVPRHVFQRMKDSNVVESYALRPSKQQEFHSTTMTAFFDTAIDPETRFYLGEDVLFCKRWRQLGGKVWAVPAHSVHFGNYGYEGGMAE
jgi:hypothetical protein